MRHSQDEPATGIPDGALLADYLAGRATGPDRETIERWMQEMPNAEQELRLLKAIWRSPTQGMTYPLDYDLALSEDREDVQAFLTRWRQRLVSEGASNTVPSSSVFTSKSRFRRSSPPWRVVAAALVACIAVIAFAVRVPVSQFGESASKIPATIYSTKQGERAEIVLSDGTRVTLNVGSRISIPETFNHGTRTVQLSGEALFTVTHHQHIPFTVQAGHSTTRVLGTSFIVRHYPLDTGASVVVRDGKVAVGSSVVTAEQQAIVNRDGLVVVRSANASRFTFADGVLTLEEMPLPRALPELGRWYDADIRLGDTALATRGIAGTFVTGSLTELTEFLEYTLKVRVVRNGRTLTLYQR